MDFMLSSISHGVQPWALFLPEVQQLFLGWLTLTRVFICLIWKTMKAFLKLEQTYSHHRSYFFIDASVRMKHLMGNGTHSRSHVSAHTRWRGWLLI